MSFHVGICCRSFHNSFPVELWDHALHKRAWVIKTDAKSSALAVDGNSSTFAMTTKTKYPFLAVDLGTTINIDFTVLNIRKGNLSNIM